MYAENKAWYLRTGERHVLCLCMKGKEIVKGNVHTVED